MTCGTCDFLRCGLQLGPDGHLIESQCMHWGEERSRDDKACAEYEREHTPREIKGQLELGV